MGGLTSLVNNIETVLVLEILDPARWQETHSANDLNLLA